jgi:hypothetical protein
VGRFVEGDPQHPYYEPLHSVTGRKEAGMIRKRYESRLNHIWNPVRHPEQQSEREMYAAMEAGLRARYERHFAEMNDLCTLLCSRALEAMMQEQR